MVLADGQIIKFLLGYLTHWRHGPSQVVDVRCKRLLDGVEYGLDVKDGPSQLSLRAYLAHYTNGGYVVVCNHRRHEFPSFSFEPYHNEAVTRYAYVTGPSLPTMNRLEHLLTA